jgi:hypothetical protein
VLRVYLCVSLSHLFTPQLSLSLPLSFLILSHTHTQAPFPLGFLVGGRSRRNEPFTMLDHLPRLECLIPTPPTRTVYRNRGRLFFFLPLHLKQARTPPPNSLIIPFCLFSLNLSWTVLPSHLPVLFPFDSTPDSNRHRLPLHVCLFS